MRELFALFLLLPIYSIARYSREGSAGWFVLGAWIANAFIFGLGGLWIGVIGVLLTAAIVFLFRERLRLARFFERQR
jgi:hypothetical protein